MEPTKNALLGKGSEFDGKLTFEGSVQIDGKFKGEINSDGTLVVGPGAEIQAEIRCGTVQIFGNVVGNVTASEMVELHEPASLRGNITSPALHIGKGVFFDGACQMTSKPQMQQPVARPMPQPVARAVQPPPLQPAGLRESQQIQAPAHVAAQQQRPSGIYLPEPSSRASGELPHKF